MKKNTSFLGKIALRKRLLKVGAGVFLLLFLCYLGTLYYYNTQKNKIAAMVINVLDEQYSGDITFDAVSIDDWVGFYSPSLAIENLVITDTATANHLRLQAEALELKLSIKDLLKGLIQIKSATLRDGEILMDNYTPLTREETLELPPILDSLELKKKLANKLLERNTRLELVNLNLRIRHHVKNKLFEIYIDEISSEIEFESETIRTKTSLDINIKTLGFNLDKGRFINGAQATGIFLSEFDLDERQLSIATFDLEIDEQEFRTKAEINFKGAGIFDIVLENEETQFLPTIGLLTAPIQRKFAGIHIDEPIYSQTKLNGTFVYKGNPRVDVSFRTEGNSGAFNDDKPLEDLSFSGRFINRIYDDERADEENKKNVRIELPELKGNYKDIGIILSDVTLLSSPDAENSLKAKVSAQGSPEDLNNFRENQHWSFRGGTFELATEISGTGTDMGSLVSASSGRFVLRNTRLVNNDNKIVLPVGSLFLSLNKNAASLEELIIALNEQDRIVIDADFKNFSTLFDPESEQKLHSKFRVDSKNLDWEDFIRLFDIVQPNQERKKPELVLQDALKDIYQKYDPSIDISIGEFHFGPFDFDNFKTAIHFDNKNSLSLDETSFGLKGGQMNLQGNLQLEKPNKIPITATLKGIADVDILNQVFDEDQLNFAGGQFQVEANINGDLLNMDGILRSSFSSLQVSDTKVTYTPEAIEFPVKLLDLVLDRDHAKLNALTLEVGGEDKATFSGNITNLSSLLFNNVDLPVRSDLNLSSERLTWEDYLMIFKENNSNITPNTPRDAEEVLAAERKLKAIVRGTYNSLNPRITVDIGEFRYKDMDGFYQFQSGLSFKDHKTLKLEETSFIYHKETGVKLSAELDISDERDTYVELSLEAAGNPEELNDVFNNDTFFFSSGEFDVEANVRGNIGALDSLLAHSSTELSVRNTFILHEPSQVLIPLKELEVTLHENTAKLKSFVLEMDSGDRITLTGKVGHISDLIFDVPPEESKAYSEVSIYSKKLVFEDFQSLFSITAQDTSAVTGAEEKPETAIKPTIRDVYNKFRPSMTTTIDDFELNGLIVNNLKTGFYFEDQNKIYLEESGFEFYDGSVSLNAHLDIAEPGKTFFSFGFDTDKIDLEKLLQAFDYFDIDALRSAKRIGGIVSLDTEIEGEVDDEGEIIPGSLKGSIKFDLEEARVVGFEPMIKSGSKIFKKERLEDIRFPPIKNTLVLSDDTIEIPLMEIQSSAFELFVNGHLGFGDVPTNIWIGFPLANLKSRDVKNVPDKKGYIASGKKVYVEAKSDEKKGMKYVLHLTPKKYYKERDMLDVYRSEIREDRSDIRKYKRDAKKAERDAKKAQSLQD
ncbi:MAG: AsmA-like C-terminal region-containing protein [Flavobacteriaceae bacterium]